MWLGMIYLLIGFVELKLRRIAFRFLGGVISILIALIALLI